MEEMIKKEAIEEKATIEEKAEPIVISLDNGEEYILEFNRNTVVMAERDGFSREEAVNKLMEMLPKLFYFAFKMHHPTIRKEKTDDILFNKLEGLNSAEMSRLIALFDEPYKTLIRVYDAEDGARKNSKATVRM